MEFDVHNEMSFSSFLAGELLFNKRVSMVELSKVMNDFSVKYNFYISDHSNDFDKLIRFVEFNGDFIELKYNYDFELRTGDKVITLYDYLYDFTTREVREYFGISDREDIIIYKPQSSKIKKLNILSKIKKTKVYV